MGLKIIKFLYRDERRHAHYLCQCSCGKFTTPDITDLRRGKVHSCGCSRRSPYSTQRQRDKWREQKRRQRNRFDPRSGVSRWYDRDLEVSARATALAPPPLAWESVDAPA